MAEIPRTSFEIQLAAEKRTDMAIAALNTRVRTAETKIAELQAQLQAVTQERDALLVVKEILEDRLVAARKP